MNILLEFSHRLASTLFGDEIQGFSSGIQSFFSYIDFVTHEQLNLVTKRPECGATREPTISRHICPCSSARRVVPHPVSVGF
jgi:hypothetical protein